MWESWFKIEMNGRLMSCWSFRWHVREVCCHDSRSVSRNFSWGVGIFSFKTLANWKKFHKNGGSKPPPPEYALEWQILIEFWGLWEYKLLISAFWEKVFNMLGIFKKTPKSPQKLSRPYQKISTPPPLKKFLDTPLDLTVIC